jgi:hypothetical protein
MQTMCLKYVCDMAFISYLWGRGYVDLEWIYYLFWITPSDRQVFCGFYRYKFRPINAFWLA